jgi:hypothetical protein
LPFIQLRQYRCIALPELLERIFINHPQNYDAPRPRGIPATSLSAQNRFSYSLTSPKAPRLTPFSRETMVLAPNRLGSKGRKRPAAL